MEALKESELRIHRRKEGKKLSQLVNESVTNIYLSIIYY